MREGIQWSYNKKTIRMFARASGIFLNEQLNIWLSCNTVFAYLEIYVYLYMQFLRLAFSSSVCLTIASLILTCYNCIARASRTPVVDSRDRVRAMAKTAFRDRHSAVHSLYAEEYFNLCCSYSTCDSQKTKGLQLRIPAQSRAGLWGPRGPKMLYSIALNTFIIYGWFSLPECFTSS